MKKYENYGKADAIWVGGHLATMAPNTSEYGEISNAALIIKDNKIVWIGPQSALDADPASLADSVYHLNGKWVTPGLIDCHTHLVYAGNRAHEFALRLQGASYEAIAQAGGGIRSTVAATRAASFEELYQQSARRLEALLKEGVTTLEIKSGYGLDMATELKMLRVAKALEDNYPVTICKTFLGAHTVPAEYKDQADAYIDYLIKELLPALHQENLVDAVDAFCEKIAFNPEQIQRLFKAAQQFKLPVKLHADQLSDLGGGKLAANFNALSADHLEHLSESSIRAMAKANTVAVLLPGAFYFLREAQLPSIKLLREYKVPIALATDCNPGTSPFTSLLLMLNMACTLFRLTPEEALAGITRNAAQALGLLNKIGTLEEGKNADFVVWDIQSPIELAYDVGLNRCVQIVKNGKVV